MENCSPCNVWGRRQRLHLTPNFIFVRFSLLRLQVLEASKSNSKAQKPTQVVRWGFCLTFGIKSTLTTNMRRCLMLWKRVSMVMGRTSHMLSRSSPPSSITTLFWIFETYFFPWHSLEASSSHPVPKEFVNILQVTVYVTDMRRYSDVNKIYADHFKPPFPVRWNMMIDDTGEKVCVNKFISKVCICSAHEMLGSYQRLH